MARTPFACTAPTGLRRRPLAFSLAALIGAQAAPFDLLARAGHVGPTTVETRAAQPIQPPRAPKTWTVKNCNDSGPDSLREIVQNPANAQSGDIVDLGQLPMLCGTRDSVITLSTGELHAWQDNLTLVGPAPASGTVALDGAHATRVLHHHGAGTLSLNSLIVRNGYYHAATEADGGCIYSGAGGVYLFETVVTGCVAKSDTSGARGGGIRTQGGVQMRFSTISGNHTQGPIDSSGGGVFTNGAFTSKYSTVSDNEAGWIGGGVLASASVMIVGSTLNGNTATYGAALFANGLLTDSQILNSTVSQNSSMNGGAVVLYAGGAQLTISNSTIAFNHSDASAAGIFVKFGALVLQSTIVADNWVGPANVASDIYVTSGQGTLTGEDNLVIASNTAPQGVITVTSDPHLGPLQFNGGPTRSHALLRGSPAIGMGNNNVNWPNDQRGVGYPRTTGPSMSVDIGAFQFDSIFADDYDG